MVMKVRKRLFPVLLAMVMVFSMMPATVFGTDGDTGTSSVSQFSDMPENWSTKALQSAVANGLLSGADGKIMPDQNLTRAQMATVITRAFGATVKGNLSGFTDVKSTDWFSDGISKAYQMGVIQGSGSLMNPNSAITRQEVFVILARAFKLQPAEKFDKTFSDGNQIADWAKGEVYAFVNAGYIQGSNGKLNPKNLITRAEFAQIFDNILKQYINTAGEFTQVAAGNIMVNAPGVTLKNLKVNGDLIIGDGVGDGEMVLDSVAVTGRMVIRGGGENSIIIKGTSSVSNVVVARVDGVVSVKVQGDADVEVIYIDDGSDDVNVEGIFGNIEIAAPEIVVKAIGATITNLKVAGEGSKIVVDAKSTIETVTVAKEATSAKVEVSGKVTSITTQAPSTQISGTGTVTKVEAQAGATGAKIETPNTQISVGAGVSGVTGGGNSQIQPGSTVNNNQSGTGTTPPTAPPPSGGGGGGGGGGGTPSVSATDINITSETTVTFNCNVAGGTVSWNGALLAGVTTVVGANTITISPAAMGTTNTLEVIRSGYTSYSNNTVYRNMVKDNAELTAALASNVPLIKLGADLALTTSTMAIKRTVTIDGNGFSVDKTVAVTANNVTIKNLEGKINTRSAHGLSGIGSATAFYLTGSGIVLDGVTVNGSTYVPTSESPVSIGIIGFNGAQFTVKNSNLSGLTTGVFAHSGYMMGAQNTFTATGNTFTNVLAGIGGTEKTDVTITGNTFVSVKAGGEGIGLGGGVGVNGASAGSYASYLESQNTFSYTVGAEAKVRDYRPTAGVVINATNFTVTSLLDGWTFKIGAVNLTAGVSGTNPYIYTITIPSGSSLKEGINNITATKANYPVCTVVVNYEGTTVSNTAGLKAAINNASAGDTISLSAGTYELTELLVISKPVTLLGKGNVTIRTSASAIWGTDNSNKHLIKIIGGTAFDPVTLENLILDSDGIAYGLNTYNNAYGVLKDVILKNSKGAGLTVNGSTIKADNLDTDNNAWGAVNVDPGGGVSTPSIFELTGNGTLAEEKQIWSDGDHISATATVTVTAFGYDKHSFSGNSKYFIWTNKLTNAASINGVIYPSIQAAVDAASPGAIVKIANGTYDLNSTLTINNAITVEGADKENTILRGVARFTSAIPGSTIILGGGATLTSVTVKRDNSGDWSTNYNNSLISFTQSLTANTTLDNCIITQGRNGVYMNTVNGAGNKAIITNNDIKDNRTGINFCGNCSNAVIENNTITGNWTLGIVTYNTGTTSGSALDTIELNKNTITGNWCGQILVKDNGINPMTEGNKISGALDISTNTFNGTITISYRGADSYWAEPAYKDLRPYSVGGTSEPKAGTPPTLRIYNQWPGAGAGFSGDAYTEHVE